MTDRELLERAAKAAGMEYDWQTDSAKIDGMWTPWDPLLDDGDAFRLAVKLRIGITPTGVAAYAEPCQPIDGVKETVGESIDIYAATRRAIVRAAAQIGGM